MKAFYFSIVFSFISASIYSQSDEKKKNDDSMIWGVALDEQAVFPGDMQKFIKSNLKWPSDNSCIKGKVHVSFDVDTNGVISNAVVKRGINQSANEEAIRVIMKMPKWTPAKRDGKPIKCRLVVPINFDIE